MRSPLYKALARLEVGEFVYLEAATKANAVSLQQRISAKSRYPDELKSRRFWTMRLVGVAVADGDTLNLVRVERLADAGGGHP